MMILIGFFILLTSFFAGSETALMSLNRIKLRSLADSGDRHAKMVQGLLEHPDQLFITMLIGTNLAIVFASSIFSAYWISQGNRYAEELTVLFVTPLLLIFGEIIPKALFRQNAFFLVTALAPFLSFSYRFFSPLGRIFSVLNNQLLRLMGQKDVRNQPLFATKAELKYLIQESEKEGMLKPYERSMVYRIFELGEKNVQKVTTPLDQIVALPSSATLEEVIRELCQSRFSWIPVYERTPNHFVGFVSLFDVAYEENVDKTVASFLRPLVSVKEDKAIDEVLITLQRKKSSMALVENHEKKTVGLVTIEDLLHEIMGGGA